MAGGITQIQTGLDQADQFLQKPEAIAASERLAQSFPAGAADPAYVMTRGDGEAVAATVREVEGVSAVRVAASGNGVTEVDAVIDAQPGSDAAVRHRRWPCVTPSPTPPTPTSGAPRPWRWTPRTPTAATCR